MQTGESIPLAPFQYQRPGSIRLWHWLSALLLFASLTTDEQMVVGLLRDKGQFPLDDLKSTVGFNSSKMASVLLGLELQNIIQIIPGKMIALA